MGYGSVGWGARGEGVWVGVRGARGMCVYVVGGGVHEAGRGGRPNPYPRGRRGHEGERGGGGQVPVPHMIHGRFMADS